MERWLAGLLLLALVTTQEVEVREDGGRVFLMGQLLVIILVIVLEVENFYYQDFDQYYTRHDGLI